MPRLRFGCRPLCCCGLAGRLYGVGLSRTAAACSGQHRPRGGSPRAGGAVFCGESPGSAAPQGIFTRDGGRRRSVQLAGGGQEIAAGVSLSSVAEEGVPAPFPWCRLWCNCCYDLPAVPEGTCAAACVARSSGLLVAAASWAAWHSPGRAVLWWESCRDLAPCCPGPAVALCCRDAVPASLGVSLAPWPVVPGLFGCSWLGRAATCACQLCPRGVWGCCSGFGLPALLRHLLYPGAASCRARRGTQGNPPPNVSAHLTTRFPNQPVLIALTVPALKSAITSDISACPGTSWGPGSPCPGVPVCASPVSPTACPPRVPLHGPPCLCAATGWSEVSRSVRFPTPGHRTVLPQLWELIPCTSPTLLASIVLPCGRERWVGDASHSRGQEQVSALPLARRSPSISGSRVVPQSPVFTVVPWAMLAFR